MLQPAAISVPGTGGDSHESDLETSNFALQINPGPDPATPGDTKLNDLPISDGDYRPNSMQSVNTVVPYDGLGHMPFSGLHGVVNPIARPSTTLGEPNFWELGYVIREVPSSSDADLGVVG